MGCFLRSFGARIFYGGLVITFNMQVFAQIPVCENAKQRVIGNEIHYEQLHRIALECNPQLRAKRTQMKQYQAEIVQAGLLINPELDVQAEDFLGTGDFSHDTNLQTTIQIIQKIELGGKRRGRIDLAELAMKQYQLELDLMQRQMSAELETLFFRALSAQKKISFTKELSKLNEKAIAIVEEQYNSGKISISEVNSVRVQHSLAQLEVQQAELELQELLLELQKLIGCDSVLQGELVGHMHHLGSPPPLKQFLKSFQSSSIYLQLSDTAMQQAKLELKQQKREAIPNLSLNAGYRYFNKNQYGATVAGFGLPLPLFNRNQGGIASAQVAIVLKQQESQQQLVDFQHRIQVDYLKLMVALRMGNAMHDTIMKRAKETLEQIQTGFKAGKYGYLDLLNAQTAVFQTRQKARESCLEYHVQRIALELLTGLKIQPKSGSNQYD